MNTRILFLLFLVASVASVTVSESLTSDEVEAVREENCAEAYKACKNPTRACCKGRPCRCNIIGTICKCEKTLGEITGWWK